MRQGQIGFNMSSRASNMENISSFEVIQNALNENVSNENIENPNIGDVGPLEGRRHDPGGGLDNPGNMPPLYENIYIGQRDRPVYENVRRETLPIPENLGMHRSIYENVELEHPETVDIPGNLRIETPVYENIGIGRGERADASEYVENDTPTYDNVDVGSLETIETPEDFDDNGPPLYETLLIRQSDILNTPDYFHNEPAIYQNTKYGTTVAKTNKLGQPLMVNKGIQTHRHLEPSTSRYSPGSPSSDIEEYDDTDNDIAANVADFADFDIPILPPHRLSTIDEQLSDIMDSITLNTLSVQDDQNQSEDESEEVPEPLPRLPEGRAPGRFAFSEYELALRRMTTTTRNWFEAKVGPALTRIPRINEPHRWSLAKLKKTTTKTTTTSSTKQKTFSPSIWRAISRKGLRIMRTKNRATSRQNILSISDSSSSKSFPTVIQTPDSPPHMSKLQNMILCAGKSTKTELSKITVPGVPKPVTDKPSGSGLTPAKKPERPLSLGVIPTIVVRPPVGETWESPPDLGDTIYFSFVRLPQHKPSSSPPPFSPTSSLPPSPPADSFPPTPEWESSSDDTTLTENYRENMQALSSIVALPAFTPDLDFSLSSLSSQPKRVDNIPLEAWRTLHGPEKDYNIGSLDCLSYEFIDTSAPTTPVLQLLPPPPPRKKKVKTQECIPDVVAAEIKPPSDFEELEDDVFERAKIRDELADDGAGCSG